MPAKDQEPVPDVPAQARLSHAGQRVADQDRTLLAMQQLETALAAAAPRREQAWRNEVRRALSVLVEAARQEAENAAQPDSMLSDIARTQPWLGNRVRRLRSHYGQLRDAIDSLQAELDTPADLVDFDGIRRRLAKVLTTWRYQRSCESDLIYEAYYDAVRTDIAEAAKGPRPAGDRSQGPS